MTFNESVIKAFWLILLLLMLFTIIGTILSNLIFKIRINNKKIRRLTIENFEAKDLYKSIKFSILFLFIYFSTLYLVFYYKSDYIFSLFNITSGTINSAMYECKIFYLSLPIYAFEITYIEYCCFLKQIRSVFLYKLFKILLFIIIASILSSIIHLNGLLYSKLIIDLLFFIYITINLRKIIVLCKK